MNDRFSVGNRLPPLTGVGRLRRAWAGTPGIGLTVDDSLIKATHRSWLALHSAAWEGDLRMAKILVAAGADVSIRDKEHNATPAKCARVAIEVTNNPECRVVADYLDEVGRGKQVIR